MISFDAGTLDVGTLAAAASVVGAVALGAYTLLRRFFITEEALDDRLAELQRLVLQEVEAERLRVGRLEGEAERTREELRLIQQARDMDARHLEESLGKPLRSIDKRLEAVVRWIQETRETQAANTGEIKALRERVQKIEDRE